MVLPERSAANEIDYGTRRHGEGTLQSLAMASERLLADAPMGIAFLDPKLRVVYANPAFVAMHGRTLESTRGRRLLEIAPHLWPDLKPLVRHVQQTGEAIVEREVCGKTAARPGEARHWLLSYYPVRSSHGVVLGLGIVMCDITERKRLEATLEHQAYHDPLSKLPNRALFLENLNRALARARRSGNSLAVLFLDLDNFKAINDSLGHSAGDALLVAVAERIRSCVRPQDTVARLGGDVFTLLIEDLTEMGDAVGIADRISRQLQAPIQLTGREVFATASIGIAHRSGDEAHADDLLRDADVAMYRAKNNGKASFVIFDRIMKTHAAERVELESDLDGAIERGEFHVCFQPIVDLVTGRVVHFEALLRWEHPRLGLISPGRFIPILEETGFIVEAGRWGLTEACRQLRQWQMACPDQPELAVGVNLTPRQMQHPDLIDDLERLVRETGLSPRCLELEMTESTVMRSDETTLNLLDRLKAKGVRLAVDDFGVGHASMAYLQSFPVDTVKIDRSIVGRLGQSQGDEAIVRALLALAPPLDLRIIAAGVETAEQLAELHGMGCTLAQGYYFARPLTSDGVGALLRGKAGELKYLWTARR